MPCSLDCNSNGLSLIIPLILLLNAIRPVFKIRNDSITHLRVYEGIYTVNRNSKLRETSMAQYKYIARNTRGLAHDTPDYKLEWVSWSRIRLCRLSEDYTIVIKEV